MGGENISKSITQPWLFFTFFHPQNQAAEEDGEDPMNFLSAVAPLSFLLDLLSVSASTATSRLLSRSRPSLPSLIIAAAAAEETVLAVSTILTAETGPPTPPVMLFDLASIGGSVDTLAL